MTFQNALTRVLTGLLFLNVSPSLLAENAHLNAKIQGSAHQHNAWFLCMPHENGCFSLQAAAKGKVFPLTSGSIHQAYILNTKNFEMTAQALPESCQADINDHQTLHMTGQLQTEGEHRARIKNLSCELVG